ncbi:glycosyltransferase family 39 protein [Mycobacterium yunnanensis]|uniref:Glycosyltransferase family 39 protein n=1 Tax=Mycobacterium yunnanensis TaxID=368477 RepID=A0A9X2YYI1_9MYCO|nr:glycosyltransferase family 39 protein [Mycobacterium yunnanensis]MCV7419896.1 glycosyltransferase family 39 protein [Mycobacterium yunnanensis]
MTLTADDVTHDAVIDEQGTPSAPRWTRPAFWALLVGTGVLYLWGLGSSGWANSYYAAAAQAGTQDWKAWLFGSFDAGNAITVDKPPAAMWVMGLSGRLFGFNEFTMLLPEALMGVGAVAMLYLVVRRTSGPSAGLIAGLVLALTPVATLMFRFNNPDALLVLLLLVAAYCTVRAIQADTARRMTMWMAWTGCAVGFAFLTKMLQAFLVVPGLAVAVLVAAPFGVWRRLGALLVAGATMIVSAGWYIALVSLWPADSRPYIAGSTDNSLLQLALGYNGIQRIAGNEGGGPGGGGGPGPGHGPGGGGMNLFFGGDPGIGRLFGASMGAEASWLLPAALIGIVVLAWTTLRAPRTDRVRAGLLLWGGWLLVTGAVFSFMAGTVHPYYNVALAPAVAALVGIAVAQLVARREKLVARLVLGAMLVATGVWSFVLLDRTPDWWPAIRWIVLAGSIVLALLIALRANRLGKASVAVVVATAVVGLAGPTAFSIYNVVSAHNGPGTMSGPQKAGGFGGPGGPGGPGARGDSAQLEALIEGTHTRWAAAGIGSMSVGDLELKTGASLMSIGGFTGGDPSPTLGQFQQYVADGQVRYFLADSGRGGPFGHRTGSASDITQWVEKTFTKTDVGGTTVYDLQSPRS